MRKIKVFTFADRCNFLLDIWLNHYIKITEEENITIIYKNITNRNIKEYLSERNFNKVNVEYVSIDITDNYNYNEKQMELLKTSDVIIYSDIDEIIFHENLLDILNNFTEPYLTTDGFEIIHDFRCEKDYNQNDKILNQRSFGVHSNMFYDKPLILRQSLTWDSSGKHNMKTHKYKINDLYLVHLCRFDFKTLLNLNNENNEIYLKN